MGGSLAPFARARKPQDCGLAPVPPTFRRGESARKVAAGYRTRAERENWKLLINLEFLFGKWLQVAAARGERWLVGHPYSSAAKRLPWAMARLASNSAATSAPPITWTVRPAA